MKMVTRCCLCIVPMATAISLGGGCAAPQMSQAQLNAIETREVDAGPEQTFGAASGALFDAGYTIAMSDRGGGLLTGTRGIDQTSARIWVSPAIEDTKFVISIQIRPIDANRSTVRVKTSKNGEPIVDQKAIDQIWLLMQRQVMMHEPLQAHG